MMLLKVLTMLLLVACAVSTRDKDKKHGIDQSHEEEHLKKVLSVIEKSDHYTEAQNNRGMHFKEPCKT